MTKVVIVHGTGVRQPGYQDFLERFRQLSRDAAPGATILPCYWGEPYGASLQLGGKSIPTYDTTRAVGVVDPEDEIVALWAILEVDPLFELRALATRPVEAVELPPTMARPGAILADAVDQLESAGALGEVLARAGMEDVFAEARDEVVRSGPFSEALDNAGEDLGEHRTAVARAIVATAMRKRDDDAMFSIDAKHRDSIVDAIIDALGGKDMGVRDWIRKQVEGLAMGWATGKIQRSRGAISDAAYPGAGDILLYQAHGEKIRAFIRDAIIQAGEPVVVIAHSLGGIACVDLLIEASLPVSHLVTVGSQASFLYEIGALRMLKPPEQLPAHFPKWTNIYDLRDFLSYVGAGVFPGRVTDVAVDGGQPFPRSHSAYWAIATFWDAVGPILR